MRIIFDIISIILVIWGFSTGDTFLFSIGMGMLFIQSGRDLNRIEKRIDTLEQNIEMEKEEIDDLNNK